MEEQLITINQVNPETFEFQDYSTSDTELLAVNTLDTVFSGSTDYIEAYIYDENQNQISSVVPLTSYTVTEGDVILRPSNDLERLGFDIGSYYITYDFYRPKLGSTLNTQYYISEISSDRTEIRLDSTQIDNALLISSSLEFIEYRDTAEYFVDFLLNFGNNQQVIANNLELDLTDDSNPTILIKLYDPLPGQFDLKSQCSVIEQISTPQSYNVVFPLLDITVDDFTYISGPNYSLNIKGQTGTPGMEFNYSTLVSSDLTSSYNQINSLLNRKEINISVNYEDYNEFVYFSSAYTRLQNFYYKVGLIESASAQLGQITSATTGSTFYSSSEASLTSIIDTTIKNFDGYEYFLYFNSGSKYSYPKSNTEPPYALYSTGSTEALTWLGSTDSSNPYYGGQAVSSSNYDENNQNSLYYAIPEYLRSDPQNEKYELFVDMVGQHYDNLWLYTKNLTTKFNADNRLDYGISKDLVADAVRDFGVKLYSNNFNTNDLYTAFLGLTPSGSKFPFPNITDSTPANTGYEYINTQISASNDIIPLDDVNKRLYKRIYHNLPYLLKTKGTVAGLRALITSYGIPDTILRINEFGGKDRNNSQDWDLKQDIYNLSLNPTSSAFTSSFTLNSTWGADENSPGAIQFRFKTNGIPSASNSPTTQSFFETDSTSTVAMGIEYNPTLLDKGTYSGSVESKYKEYGTIKFWPNIDTNPSNYASLYLPFWDGDWWSVQINRNPGNNTFTLNAANKIGENLGFTGSNTISADIGLWETSTEIRWLPQNYTQFAGVYYFPFTGSLQEVRYYTEAISESVFYDYVMNPYSFEGNGINSAPNQLAFRLPLGTLLNTGSYGDSIHPKVTGSWVTTSSFNTNSSASFSSTPTWLNNVENIYLDQTPSGMRNRITDKISTEALILPEGDTLSAFRSIQQTSYVSESFTPSVNYLEVAFSPQDQINDDIIGQMGYFNIGEYIGDPRQISSSNTNYPDLDSLRDAYFEKYINNYNVVDFIRLIKFFDNSLFKMIEDFTPARTSLSSGVVIKQHLLERNRQRPAQVTSSFHNYSGSIKPQSRNYSTGSKDTGQYEYEGGTSIYKFSGGTAGSFEPFNGLQTSVSGTLGLGPDNRYFVTQSWEESWVNVSGSSPIDRSDQREFYNGEFSGSIIPVGINDICSAYFKLSNIVYSYIPVWWDNSTFPEQNFLNPINQPPPGYAWFWSDGENVAYIKMSLQTYNGLNIGTFIQNVDWIIFTFNNPVDSEGNLLSGTQTYYFESIGIQPSSLATNPSSVGTALGYVITELSSIAVSSDDGAFYDFNFSASGDFVWHATNNINLDPAPTLNTGISASIPQGYFPAQNYPTESFFRGWASSNFYTLGTYDPYTGYLQDTLDNFNTGSHEIDNTDTTPLGGIDPKSNFPWFMNAGTGADSGYLHIPSESFEDYENIPDSSYGPISTNNYFNIAWISQSATSPTQRLNYYYNASGNSIYISGSEFQNEIKNDNLVRSSSLTTKLISVGEGSTTYTPPGQTALSIPVNNDNELWLYRGEGSGGDINSWRYNRYLHRPFKIYYVTETGSGSPSEPYDLYDPITAGYRVPLYYRDSHHGTFQTMLGTQGDESLTQAWQRPLNSGETLPSTSPTSGSFTVYSSLRQVKPFLYTTYSTLRPIDPGFDGIAVGSGSFVSISQSDGTPFARLEMRQTQNPDPFGLQSVRNLSPYWYDNTPTLGVSVSNTSNLVGQIKYGENWEGANTSSLSLTTGTQPGGSTTDTDIVFPPGSYIFTMSAFDTNMFYNGRTEFGLWTKYGDYVLYEFDNQVGSGVNPATISYTNSNYVSSTIDVLQSALSLYADSMSLLSSNTGIGIGDAILGSATTNEDDGYGGVRFARWNVNIDGNYTISLSRSSGFNNYVSMYVGNDQSQTGADPTGMTLVHTFPAYVTSGQTWVGPVTDGQQILLRFEVTSGVNRTLTFNQFYLSNLTTNTPVTALIGSPTVQGSFNEPYVITGSIANRYSSGTVVPPSYATKITDAYILYSSSLSSSLDGAYLFDVVPTQTKIYVTASVLVSSFQDSSVAVYGQAIYEEDTYGGEGGGGYTWPTASLILYTGSANNFPTEMPIAGGDIFAQTSSYSLTHHEGERITLHAVLNSTDISYNDVLKMALKVESGSHDSTFITSSLVASQYSMSFSSSIDSSIDPSIPTIFSDDQNFETAYDCQPLLNNYSEGRKNNRLQDVDYTTGILSPSNWQQIIEYSASRASVPESNYSMVRVFGPRYEGTQIASSQYNVWSPGDTGGFGKQSSIDIKRNHVAYFNSLYDPYPLLNNNTIYNIQYLIDETGDISQPKLSNISLYDIQGTFEPIPIWKNGTVDYSNQTNISLVGDTDEILFPLQGQKDFNKIISRPVPILYSQISGIFPVTKSIGIELIGNEPIDPGIVPTFNDYTSNAYGDVQIFAANRYLTIETQELANKDPELDGTQGGSDQNVTASDANTGTNLPVYDTSGGANAGYLTIPITDGDTGFASENTAGIGNNTSQPYELDFEFYVDTDATTYKLRTRDHKGGWNSHSPIDEPNVGFITVYFQKATQYGGSFSGTTIRDVGVDIIAYFPSTNAQGDNKLKIPYSSIGNSYVAVNNNTGRIDITLNSDTISTAISNAGYAGATQQRVKVYGKYNQSGNGLPIKQGNQFRLRYEGSMIVNTSNFGFKFFPQTPQGSFIGGSMRLAGGNSNPITAATASFWEFSGSGAGKSTKILLCSSPQLNKAYGRGFTQKDLVYTASLNKDFPNGREPNFTSFPPLQASWELELYDQIRFKNNEDYTYTIVNIIPPSEQTDTNLEIDGFPQLQIELDNPVPQDFENIFTSTEGGFGVALNEQATSSIDGGVSPSYERLQYGPQSFRPLDFFVIRRYVQDASSMIIQQKYPYDVNPTKLSSAGFMIPPYPVDELETSPDKILKDLIDKKLIE